MGNLDNITSRMPRQSVLSPCRVLDPSGLTMDMMVLTAPIVLASGERESKRGMSSNLEGTVTEAPPNSGVVIAALIWSPISLVSSISYLWGSPRISNPVLWGV